MMHFIVLIEFLPPADVRNVEMCSNVKVVGNVTGSVLHYILQSPNRHMQIKIFPLSMKSVGSSMNEPLFFCPILSDQVDFLFSRLSVWG